MDFDRDVSDTERPLTIRDSKTDEPESVTYSGARYLFSAVIAGYKQNYYSIANLANDAGLWFRDQGEAYVCSAQPPDGIKETTLHETLHAINETIFAPKDQLTEEQLTTLSAILYDTFKRNPELKEYVFGER